MRVFDFAKKVGIPTKELIALLQKKGIAVTSHMSTIEEDDAQAFVKGVSKPPEKQRTTPSPKKAKVEATPSPPVMEKKKTILIKKKLPPPEPEAQISQGPSSLVIEHAVSHHELPSEPLPSQGAPPLLSPSLTDAPPVIAVLPKSDAKKSDALKSLEMPPEKSLAKPTTEGKTVAFKTEEPPKKWGDKRSETKKLPPVVKGKGGLKQAVKQTWQARSLAEATGGETNETPVTVPVASRKWGDFKPIHRRAAQRGERRPPVQHLDPNKARRKTLRLYEGLTVREFSEQTGLKVPEIVAKLMEFGRMSTVNQPIDLTEASLIAESFGIQTQLIADKTEAEILEQTGVDIPGMLISRPPVITIMGHVDHGKTSLLDAIRQTRVTEGEAGGITQHIGAYTVTLSNRKVTFLDTPGHEAFTAMRARGAKVTDIVVLVVSATDGVMPQTIEAVNHAKAANVPIIVAINKIDLPDANPERITQALSHLELIPEAWGGKTIYVHVSAKKRLGIEQLLEMILLQSELMDLKANPNKQMQGVIVEAKIDPGRGPVATVLVQDGTLRVGDIFVTGAHYGRVRALVGDDGRKVTSALPSMPVEVLGLSGTPMAGDTFVVVSDEAIAKDVAQNRSHRRRAVELARSTRVTLEDHFKTMKTGEIKVLNLIIKADVQGSLEALREAFEKLNAAAVKIRVIHSGVGGVTQSDVLLAAASSAVIIGFNVRPMPDAEALAAQEKVEIRFSTIIYNAIEEVQRAMVGMLSPTLKEKILGRVDVRQVFTVPKQGTIVGGYVLNGVISRSSAGIRLIRDSVMVYEGKLASLRRFKDDVREVQTGYECGVTLQNFNDVKVGDVIEVYAYDEIPATL